MIHSSVVRPNKDIVKIVNKIIHDNRSTSLTLRSGSVFDISKIQKPSVLLLESGNVSLYRKIGEKFIFKFITPCPFGITRSPSNVKNYYLECESECRITLLDKECFYTEELDREMLFSILNVITYLVDVAEEQQLKQFIVTSNYDMIKNSIIEIWAFEEQQRDRISLYEYIMSRYEISRSSITKILKSLNDGGYIVTKRAVLKYVNKLPGKY